MEGISQRQICEGVRSVGIVPGSTVMVHSSLSAFGWVDGGADTVIDALLDVVGRSGTLVMPTFTWGAFHAEDRVVFDVRHTPCETGRVPETFRLRPEVMRSVHVCHSVAAMGADADLVMGDGVSSFGPGSAFDVLLKLNGWILLLGVSFQSCTALHAVEEFVGVSYRKHRDYEGSIVVLPDGTRIPSLAIEYLRQDETTNDFAKMGEVFDRADVLHKTRIGSAECLAIRIRDLFEVTRPMLEADRGFLSHRRRH